MDDRQFWHIVITSGLVGMIPGIKALIAWKKQARKLPAQRTDARNKKSGQLARLTNRGRPLGK